MATSYSYTISGDFTNASQVDINALQEEITDDTDISVDPTYITNTGDDVIIWFPSALSAGQETSLDSLVDAYTYVEIPQPGKSPAYQTLVDNNTNYPGDYTSIAQAFSDGNTSVYVKNGTYIETSDIVIPDGGQLIGELPGKVTIVLAGGNSIIIDGSGGTKESAGTMSISHDTNIVTGSGTTFTNLSAGDHILIGTNYCPIASVDSDTQVTLEDTYLGKSITDETYQAQSMYNGCRVANLIIANSSDVGLYIRGLRHGTFEYLAIKSCTPGIQIVDSGDCSFKAVVPSFSTGKGMEVVNCVSLSVQTLNIFNSSSHGMEISGNTMNVIIGSSAFEVNKERGLNILSQSKSINIENSVMKKNYSDGIYGATGTSCLIISDNEITDNAGNGIHMLGSAVTLSENTITNNTMSGIRVETDKAGVTENTITCSGGCTGCTGDGIYIEGDKNRLVANNVYNSSERGIYIYSGDGNILMGNIIEGSADSGIEIASGVTNSIVLGNNSTGNTGTNYVDSGTGTVSSSNITT